MRKAHDFPIPVGAIPIKFLWINPTGIAYAYIGVGAS